MKKYIYNENCFDDIENEQAMYWLGMLYADGCMHERAKSKTVSLGLIDEEHIKKFRDFVCPARKVCTTIKTIGSNFHSISITNKKITNRLLELGLIPRKSLTITFPEFLKDSKNVRHFIRGYFDGDGCICQKRHKSKYFLHLHIAGTFSFLNDIWTIFEERLGIPRTAISEQGDKIFQINIRNTWANERIKNFFYEGSTVYLERKFNIYNNHNEEKFGATSRYQGVCYSENKKWRIQYYDNFNKRRFKSGFKTEEDAANFLKNLPAGFYVKKYSHGIVSSLDNKYIKTI